VVQIIATLMTINGKLPDIRRRVGPEKINIPTQVG
jgi:hypothetical protein